MAKATGFGGVFFRANDPTALGQWYRTHLGIRETDGFWDQAGGPAVLAPFRADSDYFPTRQQVMINFKVDDMDGMIAQLEKAGITVETRPEWDGDLGRFARIRDPEGNDIELWEPREGPA